jgi:hypothetical protein
MRPGDDERAMNLVDELHAVAAALRAGGVRHALCGGLAVTIYGATRTTKDIDLLVSALELARALELVRPLGYVFAALPMTFDAGTSRERHIQRVSKIADGRTLTVDFLIASAAFEGLLDDAREITLPAGPLWVVSRAGLERMKRLAGRPQDLADLERLASGDDDG